MTDFTQLSDKELYETIDHSRRTRNITANGVNMIANMRHAKIVREGEAELQRRASVLAEAAILAEADVKYVIKHKKTKQVLDTHNDYETAKDAHSGLGDDKGDYGIYKQTKKEAELRHRNQGTSMREELDLEEAMDKDHPIVKEYHAMKKHDIKTLQGMVAGQRRVSDVSELKSKDRAITSYLRAKHGNKKVDQAFGFSEDVDYGSEKPNQYVISKRKGGEYGVSQHSAGTYPWDHSLHTGTHKTIEAAKAWAAKHAGKYPHKIEVKEEVELDEISKSTLGSYATKALRRGELAARMSSTDTDDMGNIANKRLSGVKLAVKKLGAKVGDKATVTRTTTNINKARDAAAARYTDKDDQGKAYYAAQRGIDTLRDKKMKEEVDLDEVTMGNAAQAFDLKKRAEAHKQAMLKHKDATGTDSHEKFLKSKTAFINAHKKLKALDLPKSELDQLRAGTHIPESVELDEIFASDYSGMAGHFKRAVEKAEAAHEKGNAKMKDYYLDNARNRLMGMTSKDSAKLNQTDHYSRYKKLRNVSEELDLDENIKGWKHAGSDIQKMRSAQGKDVKLVRLKKDGTENKMSDATKVFRSEEEAQEHHDRVTGLNPKTKITHNLYVGGKHVKTLGESVDLDEAEADYTKAARDTKRQGKAGEYYVTDSDMKKTHSEPFKTSTEAIRHADQRETKTGQIHTVHHIKDGKIQKQWQYSDSHRGFKAYTDHAGQPSHIRESVDLNEATKYTVTKVYNKWPKKATYAVHSADRKYHKEFDNQADAIAHHKEKSAE